MKPKTGEAAVKQAVLDYLLLVKRWPAWVRNVGGRSWKDKTGKKRVVMFGQPGQADVWGIIPEQRGRHFEIEIKKPGEEPTPAQYDWLQRVRDNGGVAFWVDSIEQLERELACL